MGKANWIKVPSLVIVFALLTFIYFDSFGLTSDATIGIDDGLVYASEIEGGGSLFHPHHLLYNWIGSMIWRLQNYLRPDHETRAVISLQLLSALAGSLGVIIMYFLLVRFTSKPVLSSVISIGLAFNRGYWFYSASAESIIPGAVATIPIIYIVALLLEEASVGRFFLLGTVSALAYALRQDNILLYLLVVLFIPFMKRGNRFKGFILSTAVILAIVGVLQLACFSSISNENFSWSAFWQWSSGYAGIPGWGTIENLKLPGLKVSVLKLLHTMGYGSVQNLALVRPKSLTDGICLLSRLNNILLIIFSICFVFYVILRARIRSQVQRVVIIFCVAWIVIRELFFTWLVPEPVMGFSVGTMIPLTIIIAVLFANAFDRGVHRRALAVIMGGLVISTAISGLLAIIPFSKSTCIRELAFFDSFSKPGDMIIVRDFHHYPLLTYYGLRKAAILDYYHEEKFRSLDEERIRGFVESAWAKGARAFLMPAERKGDHFNGRKIEQERAFFSRYEMIPLRNGEGAIMAWEIIPKTQIDPSRIEMTQPGPRSFN